MRYVFLSFYFYLFTIVSYVMNIQAQTLFCRERYFHPRSAIKLNSPFRVDAASVKAKLHPKRERGE